MVVYQAPPGSADHAAMLRLDEQAAHLAGAGDGAAVEGATASHEVVGGSVDEATKDEAAGDAVADSSVVRGQQTGALTAVGQHRGADREMGAGPTDAAGGRPPGGEEWSADDGGGTGGR